MVNGPSTAGCENMPLQPVAQDKFTVDGKPWSVNSIWETNVSRLKQFNHFLRCCQLLTS
jgi:hypothetical protein